MKKKRVVALLGGLVLLALSVLLAHNAVLYFTHGGDYGIIPEKNQVRNNVWWNAAFYTHLPAGIVCLLAPLYLLLQRFFPLPVRFHRAIGSLYVWTTLLLVCPTGMYLGLFSKGGMVTQVGFLIQGVLLALYTYQGYRASTIANVSLHFIFMIRSYAVAAVVITFRVLHLVFFFLNVPYAVNYALSQWMGLTINLLLAELAIMAALQKNRHV